MILVRLILHFIFEFVENNIKLKKNLSDLLTGLSENSKQNLASVTAQASSNQVLNSDSDKLDIDGLLNKLVIASRFDSSMVICTVLIVSNSCFSRKN
jgi:hypothetical protein